MRRTRKTKYRKLRRTYKKQRGGSALQRAKSFGNIYVNKPDLGRALRRAKSVGTLQNFRSNKLGRRSLRSSMASASSTRSASASSNAANSKRKVELCYEPKWQPSEWSGFVGAFLGDKRIPTAERKSWWAARKKWKNINKIEEQDIYKKLSKKDKSKYIHAEYRKVTGDGGFRFKCFNKTIKLDNSNSRRSFSNFFTRRRNLSSKKKEGGFFPKKRILLNSTRRKNKV